MTPITWSEAQSTQSDPKVPEVVVDKRINWLGGRDSNPDTVVQSHVSYRWTTSQYQAARCWA